MLIFDKPNLITDLSSIIEDCVKKNDNLSHLLLASRDGLPMLSTAGETSLPEETLAVINATSIYHGQMILEELKCGNIKELYVKAETGLLIFLPVGPDASLLGLTTENSDLRKILLEMRRASKMIYEILTK
ncbi:MAG: hypothetical protein HeimC3_15220 [Candidatus Heimdallarchaeota archaeon LC_3]|nr:MAG: hypothetical protein HeimC3_15220 [Candidatus Heimdallarchaeota archaeon LC_3]